MKVNEILIAAAECLGKSEVADYIANGGDNVEYEREKKELLRCYNTVENELALDYTPIRCEKSVETEDGIIEKSVLGESLAEILSVRDEYGNACGFRNLYGYVRTRAGKVVLTYTVSPAEKGADDESDFSGKISKRLMAYGIACAYSLACGSFDEAVVWDKKYKEALRAAVTERASLRIKGRRWV